MSDSKRCWHCQGSLVQFGKIHFTEIETLSGKVRVHKCCAPDAMRSLRKITAQPKEWPLQIENDE